jgi:hypothetical protein
MEIFIQVLGYLSLVFFYVLIGGAVAGLTDRARGDKAYDNTYPPPEVMGVFWPIAVPVCLTIHLVGRFIFDGLANVASIPYEALKRKEK